MRRSDKNIFFVLCMILLVIVSVTAFAEDDLLEGHNADSDLWYTGNLGQAPEGVGIYFRPSNKILHNNEAIEVSLLVTGDVMKDTVTGVDVRLNGVGWINYPATNHLATRIMPMAWKNYTSEGDLKIYLLAIVHTTEGDIYRTQAFYLSDKAVPCAHLNLVCRMDPKESGRFYTQSAVDPSKHYLSKAYMNYVCEDCGYESLLEYFQNYSEEDSPIIEGHVYSDITDDTRRDLEKSVMDIDDLVSESVEDIRYILFIDHVCDKYNIPRKDSDDAFEQFANYTGFYTSLIVQGFTQGFWKGVTLNIPDPSKHKLSLLESALKTCLKDNAESSNVFQSELMTIDDLPGICKNVEKLLTSEMDGTTKTVIQIGTKAIQEVSEYILQVHNLAVYAKYLDENKTNLLANGYRDSGVDELEDLGEALRGFVDGDDVYKYIKSITNVDLSADICETAVSSTLTYELASKKANPALKGVAKAALVTNLVDAVTSQNDLIDYEDEMWKRLVSFSSLAESYNEALEQFNNSPSSQHFSDLIARYTAVMENNIEGEEAFKAYYSKGLRSDDTKDYPKLAEKRITAMKDKMQAVMSIYKKVEPYLQSFDEKCIRCDQVNLWCDIEEGK